MPLSTHHLLAPELATVVDQLPVISLNLETLPVIRAARAQQFEALMPLLPAYPDVVMTEREVPARNSGPAVKVLVYRPAGETKIRPALVWIHGGGYVNGRAEWDSMLLNPLVRAVGCVVVSVEYRLAPETRFPGAIEDCYAALRWLHANAASLGVDPNRIAVGGLSAGGGLAACLALLARDRGEIGICFQALLQPMLDDRLAADGYDHPYVGEFIWRKTSNHFGWSALLGHEPGVADVSPYASASRATSLAGLPPTFINVGALDLFVEENLEYARRLIRDGIPTELHVYPSACHGFQVLAPEAPVTQANNNDLNSALRRALFPTT